MQNNVHAKVLACYPPVISIVINFREIGKSVIFECSTSRFTCQYDPIRCYTVHTCTLQCQSQNSCMHEYSNVYVLYRQILILIKSILNQESND